MATKVLVHKMIVDTFGNRRQALSGAALEGITCTVTSANNDVTVTEVDGGLALLEGGTQGELVTVHFKDANNNDVGSSTFNWVPTDVAMDHVEADFEMVP